MCKPDPAKYIYPENSKPTGKGTVAKLEGSVWKRSTVNLFIGCSNWRLSKLTGDVQLEGIANKLNTGPRKV